MSIFSIVEILFPLMFLLFFVLFAVTAFRGLSQWNKNNHSPRLTVPACVVARRNYRTHNNNATHTTYYATFQFESGDRLELSVPASDFGYLVEGDQGKLTFQGTRFLAFERS